MKQFLLAGALVLGVIGLAPMSASAASTAQDMLDYVAQHCDDLSPIDDCGSYDDEAREAHTKSMRIYNILRTYSSSEQQRILTGLRRLLANAHYRSTGATKFLTAYYYVVFSDVETDDKSGSVFDYLFDEDDDSGLYGDDYYYDRDDDDDDMEGGQIEDVLPDNSSTRVDDSRDRITIRNNQLALRVQAEDDDGDDASLKAGYRVVAMFENGRYEGDVYGANYKSNGYREFSFSSQFDDADEITIYLLCKNCGGSSFNEGDVFEDWDVADSVSYDLDFEGNNNDDDDDDDNDDDEDLGIADLEYDYDIFSNVVVVELTTTVKNYGNETTMLDRLEYTVDLNNSRFSEGNYDISHVETTCDDSSIDDNEDEDIDIDEDDECEITVELEFDRDDVEDEDLDIEVMIEASDDEDSSNDSESIGFRVD